MPVALAVAIGVLAFLALAGRGSGVLEAVALNLGGLGVAAGLLMLAQRCEAYVNKPAVAGRDPALVVGAGVDPATSHFSGARSTN